LASLGDFLRTENSIQFFKATTYEYRCIDQCGVCPAKLGGFNGPLWRSLWDQSGVRSRPFKRRVIPSLTSAFASFAPFARHFLGLCVVKHPHSDSLVDGLRTCVAAPSR
jgi:hypothetical protein